MMLRKDIWPTHPLPLWNLPFKSSLSLLSITSSTRPSKTFQYILLGIEPVDDISFEHLCIDTIYSS